MMLKWYHQMLEEIKEISCQRKKLKFEMKSVMKRVLSKFKKWNQRWFQGSKKKKNSISLKNRRLINGWKFLE
jgi:hypothetical protein